MSVSIRKSLARVCREYDTARKEPFAKHPLADFLREQAQQAVHDVLLERFGNLTCKGHPGQGKWATWPMISIVDPFVTETPQGGYYVVYLFSADRQHISLSLNQGYKHLVKEYGRAGTRIILQDRAALGRELLDVSVCPNLGASEINLGVRGKKSPGHEYELGHIFGRSYDSTDLPDDDELCQDLLKLCELYLELTVCGEFPFGTSNVPEVSNGAQAWQNSYPEGQRKLRMHVYIERNRQLVEQVKQKREPICECCGFDFERMYGEIGRSFIEAHHVVPLSELSDPTSSRPQDIALLCSNCHRMVHRLDDTDLERLKGIVCDRKRHFIDSCG